MTSGVGARHFFPRSHCSFRSTWKRRGEGHQEGTCGSGGADVGVLSRGRGWSEGKRGNGHFGNISCLLDTGLDPWLSYSTLPASATGRCFPPHCIAHDKRLLRSVALSR